MIDIREMFDENEKPLERLVTDGGFAGVFRKIGCIGDSLSSGEFQGHDADGNVVYPDFYDYSWGQYLARFSGLTVENLSRGGMSAKWYMDTWADENDCWNRGLDCQAFIIALGVNDTSCVLRNEIELGSTDDIDFADWRNNKQTVIGCYSQIMQKIMERQPDVQFFLMTLPRDNGFGDLEKRAPLIRELNENIRRLAVLFPRVWVLDFDKYAPDYDSYFREKFYMDGHMNPAGYLFTGKLVASYLDFIVRHHIEDFEQIGFYNTDYRNNNYRK